MTWKIDYYSEEVQAGIKAWPKKIFAKYLYIIKLMKDLGPNLGLPHTDSFGDGLFEIRARGQEGIARAFFCTLEGKRIIILHEFVKKTPSTPDKEKAIARARLNEVRRK